MNERERIGARLRAERRHAGLTLAEVSAAAGLSVGFVCDLELGRKRLLAATAAKLAPAIGCEVGTFDPYVLVPLSWVRPERVAEAEAGEAS